MNIAALCLSAKVFSVNSKLYEPAINESFLHEIPFSHQFAKVFFLERVRLCGNLYMNLGANSTLLYLNNAHYSQTSPLSSASGSFD